VVNKRLAPHEVVRKTTGLEHQRAGRVDHQFHEANVQERQQHGRAQQDEA
jgi:hypothetical protein